MSSLRLTVMICICFLACIGCKNIDGNSNNKVYRSNLLTALKQFKNRLDAKDADSLSTVLPKQIIQGSNFETKDVVNTCKDFFAHLDINHLNTSDTISSEIVKKGSPCLERFTIIVAADSITFEYNMDKNPDYKINENDTADELDQSSLCEHITWYNFKLIKGKLKLTSLGGAD